MKIEMRFHKQYVAKTSLFNIPVSCHIVETFYFFSDPDEMDIYIYTWVVWILKDIFLQYIDIKHLEQLSE